MSGLPPGRSHQTAFWPGLDRPHEFERKFQQGTAKHGSHHPQSSVDSGYCTGQEYPSNEVNHLKSERAELKEEIQHKDQIIQDQKRMIQERDEMIQNQKRKIHEKDQRNRNILRAHLHDADELRSCEAERDQLKKDKLRLEHDLSASVQTSADIRKDLAATLTDISDHAGAEQVLRNLVNALDEECTRLAATSAPVEEVRKLLGDATRAMIQRGEVLLESARYAEAESCFREVIAGRPADPRFNWHTSPRDVNAAQLGLCKALTEQNDDDKWEEALQFHHTAQRLLLDNQSTSVDRSWAIQVLTECPSIYIKQKNFAGARQSMISIWSLSQKLDDTEVTALTKHTLDVLAEIPSSHALDRLGILECACDNAVDRCISDDFKCQMMWTFVKGLFRCPPPTPWKKAQSTLDCLRAMSEQTQDGNLADTARIEVYAIFFHRRLHEWHEAGEAAIDFLEKYGYDRCLMEGESGLNYLEILSEVIQELVDRSRQQQSVAERRKIREKAYDFFTKCVAQVRQETFYPDECNLITGIIEAGQKLLKELKKSKRTSATSISESDALVGNVERELQYLSRLVSVLNGKENADGAASRGKRFGLRSVRTTSEP